jgi:hypothetical protein
MSLLYQYCTDNEPLNMNGKLFYLKTQFVSRSKHLSPWFLKIINTDIMDGKVAVCSQINTKHINLFKAPVRTVL